VEESVWGAFLGACKTHKLTNLGKLAAGKVLDLRPNMVGAYGMLSSIYAAEGKWGKFADIRKLMRGLDRSKKTRFIVLLLEIRWVLTLKNNNNKKGLKINENEYLLK
jgi:hypothetical protein